VREAGGGAGLFEPFLTYSQGMVRAVVPPEECTLAGALSVIGERWTMLILREAFFGVKRFEQMQRDLGIARNILADRLQKLVTQGIFTRVRYQERPERYEYRLTEKGLDLYPAIVALMRWGDKHLAGELGPPVTLVHRSCGQEIEPQLTCSACGERLVARDVTPQHGRGAQQVA
jgi:DNA-binding HxlR family transcriptional regulator